MGTLLKAFVRIREASSGQTMTEYALIMAAIAVACFAAYNTFGNTVAGYVNNLAADL